jgi:hypothetical protein
MFRYVITTILFFVTFSVSVQAAVTVDHLLPSIYYTTSDSGIRIFGSSIDGASLLGGYFLNDTDLDGATISCRFYCDWPMGCGAFDDRKTSLSQDQFSVRLVVTFVKTGFLPIIKEFPLQKTFGHAGYNNGVAYMAIRCKSTLTLPNWDNPDDPFGDGGGGGDDEEDDEDEVCCEHHAAIQGALESINDKLTITDPGNLILPPVDNVVLVLPSDVSEHPLTYFERKGFGELPSFSYEGFFKDLSKKLEDKFGEKLEEKFGLVLLSERLTHPSSGNKDLSFTIDFQLDDPFNVHVGPRKIDVGKYINDYASLPIASIIRLILLAYLGICFVLAVVKLIFLTPF